VARHRASGIGHEALDQMQHAVGTIGEGFAEFLGIDPGRRLAFVEPAFGARGFLGRRQIEQVRK
jgi:hypothetical protein